MQVYVDNVVVVVGAQPTDDLMTSIVVGTPAAFANKTSIIARRR